MPDSARPNQSTFRNLWTGACLGLTLGALIGAVAGLSTVAAHAYRTLGLEALAWSTVARHTWGWALYGGVAFGLTHGFAALWRARRGERRSGLDAVAGAIILLGLAGAVLVPLNRTPWYPGATSALGLLLNAGIVLLAGLAGFLATAGRMGQWLSSPGMGRKTAIAGGAVAVTCAALWITSRLVLPATAGAPSVVLISIDTLRYDHMSMNGYARETTPHIDAFAAESVSFTQATTPRPKTTPSVASMLTGMYPHRAGVRRLIDRLPSRAVTLAEIFKNAGYRTGAVICNYVLNGGQSGLGAGFDLYVDDTPEVDGTQQDARPATDDAIDWLRRNRDHPFFLWIHYMDPHGPYTPPPPYDTRFVSPERGSWHVALAAIPEASRLGDEQDVHVYIDRYDGEILYADHHVGRLLAAIDELASADRTIVVVTTDHGESLGEHDYYFEHGQYLYDNCSRIPLIIRYPGVDAGRVIDAPVEIIDIAPTLAGLAALDLPAAIDGSDLRPLLEGGDSPRPAIAFIERYTMMKAVRTPHWKLIHTYTTDGAIERRELYDLEADPHESEDLYASTPEPVERLEPALLAWTEQDRHMALRPGVEREGENAPEELLKKLKALGYVD